MPKQLHYDRLLCGTILALLFFGLVMVFSATAGGEETSFRGITRQVVAVLLGLAAMRVFMFLDYRRLSNPKVIVLVLAVSITLLVAVLVGAQAANTNRFLRVWGMSFQPSELAKLALVLFLAFFLGKHAGRLNEWRTLLRVVFLPLTLGLLVVAGRDLGGAMVLVLIAAVMLWAAGLRLSYFVAGTAGLVPLFALGVWLEPYRIRRLFTFLHPESDPTGAGFQILQSQIAVGSGGLWGQGLMEGRQKMRFLPEAHTDFIFALICEEAGFIVASLVVLAFGVILWRGLRTAMRTPEGFGRFLATGLTAMIVCQALVNIGVVLALLPTKGMPLPFISYGGTAMLMALTASGVLLNVSQHAE